MSRSLAIVFALSLLGACPAAAQEGARAVIEKAVQAYGGKDNLAKLQAMRMKLKGTIDYDGKDAPFLLDSVYQLPDKFKNSMVLTVQDMKLKSVEVFDGTRGWTSDGSEVKAAEGPVLAEMKASAHGSRVESFLPLLQDKGYTLTLLDPIDVASRPAVGVKVAFEGFKDIKLYFDKETGLLAKTERIAEDEPGKPATVETFYSDYKAVDGVKISMKFTMRRAGKKYVEGEVTEVKYESKLPENEFAKP